MEATRPRRPGRIQRPELRRRRALQVVGEQGSRSGVDGSDSFGPSSTTFGPSPNNRDRPSVRQAFPQSQPHRVRSRRKTRPGLRRMAASRRIHRRCDSSVCSSTWTKLWAGTLSGASNACGRQSNRTKRPVAPEGPNERDERLKFIDGGKALLSSTAWTGTLRTGRRTPPARSRRLARSASTRPRRG